MATNIQGNYGRVFRGPEPNKSQGPAKSKKSVTSGSKSTLTDGVTTEFSQEGLSALAKSSTAKSTGQDVQSMLADRYKDAQILVGNSLEDVADKLDRTKSFNIVLSEDEMDILAHGTEEEKDALLKKLDDAVETAKKLGEEAEQLQADQMADEDYIGNIISGVGVEVDTEGNKQLFASLDRLTESQKQRLEELKEKKAEEKEKAEKEAEEEPIEVTRTTYMADEEDRDLLFETLSEGLKTA